MKQKRRYEIISALTTITAIVYILIGVFAANTFGTMGDFIGIVILLCAILLGCRTLVMWINHSIENEK